MSDSSCSWAFIPCGLVMLVAFFLAIWPVLYRKSFSERMRKRLEGVTFKLVLFPKLGEISSQGLYLQNLIKELRSYGLVVSEPIDPVVERRVGREIALEQTNLLPDLSICLYHRLDRSIAGRSLHAIYFEPLPSLMSAVAKTLIRLEVPKMVYVKRLNSRSAVKKSTRVILKMVEKILNSPRSAPPPGVFYFLIFVFGNEVM